MITITRGDTHPYLPARILDTRNLPVDVSGATLAGTVISPAGVRSEASAVFDDEGTGTGSDGLVALELADTSSMDAGVWGYQISAAGTDTYTSFPRFFRVLTDA